MFKLTNIKRVILALFFIVSAFGFIRTSVTLYKNTKRLTDLQSRLSVLENKKVSLEKQLEFTESDYFIEMEARNKLNYKKPSEKVFVMEELGFEKDKDVLSATSVLEGNKDKKDKKSNLLMWLDLIF